MLYETEGGRGGEGGALTSSVGTRTTLIMNARLASFVLRAASGGTRLLMSSALATSLPSSPASFPSAPPGSTPGTNACAASWRGAASGLRASPPSTHDSCFDWSFGGGEPPGAFGESAWDPGDPGELGTLGGPGEPGGELPPSDPDDFGERALLFFFFFFAAFLSLRRRLHTTLWTAQSSRWWSFEQYPCV